MEHPPTVTPHPPLHLFAGLFAGTLLLTRLLSALHQTVLASRWPVLGFCVPGGAGDANYEVCGRVPPNSPPRSLVTGKLCRGSMEARPETNFVEADRMFYW